MVLLGDECQVVARLSPFGDSVILTLDRCTVCTERTIGSEIILDAPNVHLGDEAQLVAHFGPFGDTVILMQDRLHDLHRTNHRHINHFGCSRWYSKVTNLKW